MMVVGQHYDPHLQGVDHVACCLHLMTRGVIDSCIPMKPAVHPRLTTLLHQAVRRFTSESLSAKELFGRVGSAAKRGPDGLFGARD